MAKAKIVNGEGMVRILAGNNQEIVGWVDTEWREEPVVVHSIVNACVLSQEPWGVEHLRALIDPDPAERAKNEAKFRRMVKQHRVKNGECYVCGRKINENKSDTAECDGCGNLFHYPGCDRGWHDPDADCNAGHYCSDCYPDLLGW